MKSLSNITNDNIKDQLNEYHLMVSEILTGIDTEITALRNGQIKIGQKVEVLDPAVIQTNKEIAGIRENLRILEKEVVSLMAKFDELKEYAENGFNLVLRKING
jgi:predicted nuclease with TOPRIM domain